MKCGAPHHAMAALVPNPARLLNVRCLDNQRSRPRTVGNVMEKRVSARHENRPGLLNGEHGCVLSRPLPVSLISRALFLFKQCFKSSTFQESRILVLSQT